MTKITHCQFFLKKSSIFEQNSQNQENKIPKSNLKQPLTFTNQVNLPYSHFGDENQHDRNEVDNRQHFQGIGSFFPQQVNGNFLQFPPSINSAKNLPELIKTSLTSSNIERDNPLNDDSIEDFRLDTVIGNLVNFAKSHNGSR